MELLDDPFLNENLNPFFLDAVKNYWKLVSESGQERQQILEAQRNLIRFTFRKLFQKIYLEKKPAINGKVFFLSCISSDGLGDYFALYKSARTLKQSHPQLDIEVAYTHERKLPKIKTADYLLSDAAEHAFEQTPMTRVLGPVLEGKELYPFAEELLELREEKRRTEQDYGTIVKKNAFAASALKELLEERERQIDNMEQSLRLSRKAEHLYKELQESLAIVHIALALNTFENPLLAKKSFYFAESGNFQGIANAFRYNWYSMGLQPFEEGIFLNKKRSGDVVAKKLGTYLCYLTKTPFQIEAFVYLVSMLEKEDQRDIDIYLPPIALQLKSQILAAFGVGAVFLNSKKILDCSHSQKVLRLNQVLPLPQEEFTKLLDTSADIVGCTGDNSLSEGLSLGKIPFYELRPHKLDTMQGFVQIAKGKHWSNVANYFEAFISLGKESAESFAEKLFVCLTQPSFKEEWGKLLQFLQKEYCFEKALVSHLNRHFHFLLKPNLRQLEESYISRFFDKEILGKQAFNLFQRDF